MSKNIKKKSIIEKNYSKNTERNRIEKRTAMVFKNLDFDKKIKEKWGKYIKAIIEVKREVSRYNTKTKEWELSSEISYYLATKDDLSAKEFNKFIREHWHIENKNHYVRDVSMKEDMSRIRIKPGNFARIRSFGLNTMRINKIKNVKLGMFENLLDFENLIKFKGLS